MPRARGKARRFVGRKIASVRVVEAMRALGMNNKELCARFSIGMTTLHNIFTGKSVSRRTLNKIDCRLRNPPMHKRTMFEVQVELLAKGHGEGAIIARRMFQDYLEIFEKYGTSLFVSHKVRKLWVFPPRNACLVVSDALCGILQVLVKIHQLCPQYEKVFYEKAPKIYANLENFMASSEQRLARGIGMLKLDM